VRRSLLDWCTEALAPLGQAPARHHKLIIAKLEAVARGEIDRLMIYAPPGSAKSTYATVLFPSWWFTQFPRSAIISASHTGDLAESFGRRVRNLVDGHGDLLGYTLSADSRAAGKWDTDSGGEYLAAGVGKAIAGRRADLAIIDDPVASREDAESEGQRDRAYNWYRGDLYDRLKPGARIVLIMTRWHEDDLGGRLDTDELEGADRWHRILLPALSEHEDDPLGRAAGEALWPEWEDEEKLQRKRVVVGEREFIAKYQQRPAPQGGAIFNPDQMPMIDHLPPQIRQPGGSNVYQLSTLSRNLRVVALSEDQETSPRRVRAWDLSATAKIGTRDPDYTVGLLMCRTLDGRYVVENVVRDRGSPQAMEALIATTAEADGEDVLVSLPQDPGQAGKAQVGYLVRALAGSRVVTRVMSGEKATRAAPVAAQVNVGNVSMIRAGWNRKFVEELASFPNGTHDDQVDALSDAFVRLVPPRRRQDLEDARPIALYRR
jgi:predicted phage terminase large subunit-like protein